MLGQAPRPCQLLAVKCYLYLIDIWPVFIVPSVNPLRGAIYLFIHSFMFIYYMLTCYL